GAKPFDVHCPARDAALEALYGLCRADQLAGATPPRILLAGLFVQLSRRRRATDRACVRKLVRHGIGRALVEHHAHDLRDDVARTLNHDRVADTDVGPVADRLAIAVEAGDVVLVMQRHVDDGDTADRHWIEAADGRQRARTANLDVDLTQHGSGLFGRELVGN